MKGIRASAGRLVALTILVVLFSRPVALDAQRPPAVSFETLGSALDSLRRELRIPGLAVGVVSGQQLVWARGYGHADVERRIPVTPDTPFDIASITKTFASVMVLRLVEQGRVSLDDRVGKYYEPYANSDVRVRHLLTHTSQGTPGERYEYSGNNFAELFDVIVKGSGRRLREYLSTELLQPLGTTNTSPGNDLRDSPDAMAQLLGAERAANYIAALNRAAKSYTIDSGGALVETPPALGGISPAHGIVSSVTDLARWDVALDQHRFISRASQTLAWTPARSTNGNVLPYGLGWFVQDRGGVRMLWHYGYYPDHYSSLLLKVPGHDVTLILLANSDGLSAPFRLGQGDVTESAFACVFLRQFVSRAAGDCAPRSAARIAAWHRGERDA